LITSFFFSSSWGVGVGITVDFWISLLVVVVVLSVLEASNYESIKGKGSGSLGFTSLSVLISAFTLAGFF